MLATGLAGCGKADPGTKDAQSGLPLLNAMHGAAYRVKSESMAPTYTLDTIVAYEKRAFAVGDVVVFHPPEGAEQEKCGPLPHLIPRGVPSVNAPWRGQLATGSSSGSSPDRAMRSTYAKVTSTAGREGLVRSGESPTPMSGSAVTISSATTSARSPCRPAIGTCWATTAASRTTVVCGARCHRAGFWVLS